MMSAKTMKTADADTQASGGGLPGRASGTLPEQPVPGGAQKGTFCIRRFVYILKWKEFIYT